MSYKAIYTYAWDLAEDGVATCIADFQRLGLDTVTIAGTYHAGKFLRPHGKAGKVYFPEDGTAYFRTDPSRYGAIKPIANSLLAEHDVLGELTSQQAMAVNVWLVLLHNTQLGMAHPQAVVRNAFGDPYYYNLCPSAPEARAYADRSRPRRHRELSGGGHLDGSAGLYALRAWLSPRVRAAPFQPLAREPAGALLLRPLCRRSRGPGHRCPPAQGAGCARYRGLSRQRHRLSARHGRGLLARRYRRRRRSPPLPRFPQQCGDLAGRRDPRRGAQGCEGGGDPVRGAAHRRRLVRGQRPARPRRHAPASSRPAFTSPRQCG